MSIRAVEKVKSLKVSDVMHKDVVSIDGSATVTEAVALMRKRHVSSLLVDRRTHDDAWGMLVRKDVVSKVIDPSKDPIRSRSSRL